jgi:hypothetical protein
VASAEKPGRMGKAALTGVGGVGEEVCQIGAQASSIHMWPPREVELAITKRREAAQQIDSARA